MTRRWLTSSLSTKLDASQPGGRRFLLHCPHYAWWGFLITPASGTGGGVPLVLAVTAQSLVDSSSAGLSWAKWYLDNAALCGPQPLLEQHRGAAMLGLHLNMAKCKLWCPSAVAHSCPTYRSTLGAPVSRSWGSPGQRPLRRLFLGRLAQAGRAQLPQLALLPLCN